MSKFVTAGEIMVELALKIVKGVAIIFLINQYLNNIERTFTDAVFIVGVFMLMLIDERLADLADKPPLTIVPIESTEDELKEIKNAVEQQIKR